MNGIQVQNSRQAAQLVRSANGSIVLLKCAEEHLLMWWLSPSAGCSSLHPSSPCDVNNMQPPARADGACGDTAVTAWCHGAFSGVREQQLCQGQRKALMVVLLPGSSKALAQQYVHATLQLLYILPLFSAWGSQDGKADMAWLGVTLLVGDLQDLVVLSLTILYLHQHTGCARACHALVRFSLVWRGVHYQQPRLTCRTAAITAVVVLLPVAAAMTLSALHM